MQILIDMPDNLYETINIDEYGVHKGKIYDIIRNGTPLPKGHGDLIDRKELLKQPIDLSNVPSNYVQIAPTIIEADKESEVV